MLFKRTNILHFWRSHKTRGCLDIIRLSNKQSLQQRKETLSFSAVTMAKLGDCSLVTKMCDQIFLTANKE